jgi:hypothetical protein
MKSKWMAARASVFAMKSMKMMPDLIRIDMACNNPDNGNFVGRVCQIQLPNGALELTAKAWNITSFTGCPKLDESSSKVVLSGKAWPIVRSKEWFGNWCWNAYWFESREALNFLVWLHGRSLFRCEGGWSDLCDVWAKPLPIALHEVWRVRLVEESRRG